MFKVLGVDHIGVAVKDLEEGKNFWADVIGIPCTNQETVAEQKVTTTFHPTPNGSEIELLIGTAPDSPITKYIEKNRRGRREDRVPPSESDEGRSPRDL